MEIPKDAPSLRKWTLLGGIGAVLVLAVVVVVSLRSSFGAIFHEKNNVLVFKAVVRGDFVEQVPAYGTLKSDVRRSVVSKVSGTVTQIIKLAGEPVKKDDVIVVLTNPQLNQEVRKAELSLKDAEAALQQTKAEIADNHLELQNTYVINQSDAKAQLAQLTAREKLAKLNIISTLELMQYQATYDKAVLAEKLAKKIQKGNLDLEDMLSQLRQLMRSITRVSRKSNTRCRVSHRAPTISRFSCVKPCL